jgi:hypothetical protein
VLDELDSGLDRAAKRTCARNLLQTLELCVAEVAAHLYGDVEPARRRTMVVVDVDRHVAEIPILRPRVHDERRRDASRQRSREELVRRRSAPLAAEVRWLVGDQPVPAVDHDHLPQSVGNRARCGVKRHRPPTTCPPAVSTASGRPRNDVRITTARRVAAKAAETVASRGARPCAARVPTRRDSSASTPPSTRRAQCSGAPLRRAQSRARVPEQGSRSATNRQELEAASLGGQRGSVCVPQDERRRAGLPKPGAARPLRGRGHPASALAA